MKFSRSICFLIFFSAYGGSSALAQKLTLNTTNLNSTAGLSQNSIQCLLKDKHGFMWFGTQDGLNKYDGFKFTIYKHSNTNPATIPGNFINSLCEDADGNLWVGTRLGGLCRYDIANDAFITFKHDSLDAKSIDDNNINIIYKDKLANLWVGTPSGLNLYDKKTGKFKHFNNTSDTTSLSNSNIYSILEDHNDNLWVGTGKGLNLFDRKNGKCTRFTDKKDGDNNVITAITEDEQKNIWIGTSKGINLVEKKKHSFIAYTIDADKNLPGNVNSIYCLLKAKGNRFWIGSNTTLQLFDADKRTLIPINEHTDGENLMPDDGIYSLLEDDAGILWMGTSSEGVIKYDRNLTLFPSYRASLTTTPSAKNIIRNIAEDKKGNLYLATDVGLEYFNRADGTYTSYLHNVKNTNSPATNYLLSVIVSKKNDAVWVGTFSGGLDCLNPKTGKFTHFKSGTGDNDINGDAVYVLMEDRKGNIWIGSDQGGLQVYNPATKTFTRYVHDDKKPNSVCDNTVEALTEDKDGNIWIGGYSNGISIFNPVTNTFKNINTRNSNITNNVISAFYQDAKGNMWVGTMEGGLNCYEQRTHKFKSFTGKNGVINNTINYIAGDADGNIWLSTIQGITRFDPVHLQYKNYGYHNGLKSLEFNLGTGAKLKSGEIAFGNINGFNIIDPGKLLFDNNKPRVAITGFELFNKPVTIGAQDSPLKQNIETTKEIILKYSQSIFSIEFAALDYSIPEENKYAYKLDGFDTEWRYVGNQRKATYTNLDPGTYTFRVKAANKDNIWNEKATTIKIIIIPPYWQTWWFRILCGLAFIGLYYSFYLYRVNFIRKQRIELKKQVKIRTEELLIVNAQLTDQKTQEQNARLIAEKAMDEAHKASLAKTTFLATMSHEIRTPMNGVLGMAALLAETEQNSEQREYTDAIINSGESLLMVINDILDFSKIESGKLELDYQTFNLARCIQDVLALFAFKAAETAIDVDYYIAEGVPPVIIADSLRLRQVLTNLVGNAIKFTHKGSVRISVTAGKTSEAGLELCFEITDTGIGIPASQIGQLFQAFKQVDSSITRQYGGSGLGLVICERLVTLMGGNITVKSQPGAGSTFIFSITCKEASQHSASVLPAPLNQQQIKDGIELGPEKEALLKAGVKKSLLSDQFAVEYPLNILVAEDNLMNQRLILRVLAKLGYQPALANDGEEVLIMMSQNPYDLILMDIQMPKMDGLEATRIIRQLYGPRPLIAAMTANALNEDKENCINAGMEEYLSKPISIDILTQKLAALFNALNETVY